MTTKYNNSTHIKNRANGGDGRILAMLQLLPGVRREGDYTYTVQLDLDLTETDNDPRLLAE